MTNAKHTPGPWKVGDRDSRGFTVMPDNGTERGSLLSVARQVSPENVRLIASAPDLLTALREVRAKLDLSLECEYRNQSDSLMIEARTLVDIAISNATGEPL